MADLYARIQARTRFIQDVLNLLTQEEYAPGDQKEMRAACRAWRPDSKARPSLRSIQRILGRVSPDGEPGRRRLDMADRAVRSIRRDVLDDVSMTMRETALFCLSHKDPDVRELAAYADDAVRALDRWLERPWEPARASAEITPAILQVSIGLTQANQKEAPGELTALYVRKAAAAEAYRLMEQIA